MRRFFRTTTVTLAFMICLSGLVLSGMAFADRCVDNGDGTVTDNYRNLMWQQATAGPMNWDDAKSYCASLSLGGHFTWGLPSRDSLQLLYQSPCMNMMDKGMDYYWSSTPNDDFSDADFFWLINVNGGKASAHRSNVHGLVRAVRTVQ